MGAALLPILTCISIVQLVYMFSIPAIKSCLGCRTRSYKDPETNSQITCKCSETSAGGAVAPLFYPLGQRIFMKKGIESKMKSNLQLCSYSVSSMEHCHEDLPSFFGLITSKDYPFSVFVEDGVWERKIWMEDKRN